MAQFDHDRFLATLTSRPGVYRMLNGEQAVIYVGKAANLKKRIASYFAKRCDSPKTRAMVRQIHGIEVTVTRTEGEALLLEGNLIKELKPRFNVVFRDDKSYPFLYLSSDQWIPRLSFYRGARSGKGRYFGPFPSAGSARRTLNLTQKLFQLRQCDDSFFRNRTRPCLQYQIHRCSAPCVGIIGPEQYREDVELAVMFLEGRNEEVVEALTRPMQAAAQSLDFERAAHYRDQLASLRRIQEQQHLAAPSGECDLIACAVREGQACIQVFYIRGGRNLGNKSFFPRHDPDEPAEEIIEAFLTQHYLSAQGRQHIPPLIYVSHPPRDRALIEAVLTRERGRPVRIRHRVRGDHLRWIEMAGENALIALQQQLSMREKHTSRLEALRSILRVDEPPERIECFDISHTLGEAAVASCIVFGPQGPLKGDYRRFNITGVASGDDYGAMRQVIERRYARIKREEGKLPDLILIDGGKGQVAAAKAVLEELQLDEIELMGVAKAPSRRSGFESLVLSDGLRRLRLAPDNPALHLVLAIRDEAHRFAVTGHRQRRARRRRESSLEQIEGIGTRRRQELLRHFGGLHGVERAGVVELSKVPGINRKLAQKVYDALHGR